jgi:hypothetical protein
VLTTPARHLLGIVAFSVVAGITFLLGDVVLGDVSSVREGWDAFWAALFVWNRGDLWGFVLFLSLFLGSATAAALVLFTRDREVPPDQDVEVPPTTASLWPLAAALGGGILVVGLATNTQLAILGLLVIGFAAVEWAVTAYTDRYSASPRDNKALRDRVMTPIEIPVFAVAIVAVPVAMLSRILLATTEEGAPIIASLVGVIVLTLAFVYYAKPALGRTLVAGAALLIAVGIIVGGIVGAAIGERDFEQHIEHEDTGDGGQGNEAPDEGVTEEGSAFVLVTSQAEGANV